MAAFMVREKGRKDRLYTLDLQKTVIGRSRKCQLVLPNSSVSRQHAHVLRASDGYTLVDLESQNGTLVNGKRAQRCMLKHGDQVQLGKYVLVFQGDDELRANAELKVIESYVAQDMRSSSGMTDYVALAELERLRKVSSVLADAEVLSLGAKRGNWRPGDKSLLFGTKDGVPVEGVMWGGLGGLVGAVAEVSWDGQRHILKRTSRLVTVTLQGKPVLEQAPLVAGNSFTVGKSSFAYRVNQPR